MSHISVPESHEPVVVRGVDAEALRPIGHYLLADSSATGGALSTHRVTLGRGEDGAVPHRHDRSDELFFMLDGVLDVLVGERILTIADGDLLVVPAGMTHAWGPHPGREADLLVVITPGIERFEYLRHVTRISTGEATRESLLALQDSYDTHFVDSPVWRVRPGHRHVNPALS